MRRGFQRSLAAVLIAATGAGGLLAMRPPALVRGAIEHEYYERTLRDSFMDNAQLAERLGLGKSKELPGFPQLTRPATSTGIWFITSRRFSKKAAW